MKAEIPFRFRYHAHPLMRALLGVIIGYWLADQMEVRWQPCGWIALLVSPTILLRRWKPVHRFPALLMAWMLASWGHFTLLKPSINARIPTPQLACVRVESEVKPTAKGWKIRLGYQGRRWLAYGKGPPPVNSFPGQRWVVRLKTLPWPSSPLPGGFDFGQWLLRQGFSGCLSIDTFLVLPSEHQVFRWSAFWGSARKQFQSFLVRHAPNQTAVYWIEALLLGQDDGLSESVQLDFRNTGTLHVLAISGLHVGLLYWLIDRILSLLQVNDRWKKPFLFLFLWSFAGLTDLPESICRASMMYSFSMLASIKNRTIEGSHSLCGSAILILWIKPASLWSAGFLLSHAAVAGLLLIYPLFENVQERFPRGLKWLAEGFFLSLSAQIATLPFCFNLFGQFPTWFWLANLWAVPLSTICLGASILWIPLQYIPWIDTMADLGLSFLIEAMCYPVMKMADWPLAVIALPPIPLLSLISLTGILTLFIFRLKGYQTQTVWFIWLCNFCFIGWIFHHSQTRWMNLNHHVSQTSTPYHFIRRGQHSILLLRTNLSGRDSSMLKEHFRWFPCQKTQTFISDNKQKHSFSP